MNAQKQETIANSTIKNDSLLSKVPKKVQTNNPEMGSYDQAKLSECRNVILSKANKRQKADFEEIVRLIGNFGEREKGMAILMLAILVKSELFEPAVLKAVKYAAQNCNAVDFCHVAAAVAACGVAPDKEFGNRLNVQRNSVRLLLDMKDEEIVKNALEIKGMLLAESGITTGAGQLIEMSKFLVFVHRRLDLFLHFEDYAGLLGESTVISQDAGANRPYAKYEFAHAIYNIGKDSTVRLNKELGIEYFLRYSPELLKELERNLDKKYNSKKPLLLVTYNKNDWNGSFYIGGRNLDELTKFYKVIVVEVDTEDAFYAKVQQVAEKYGKIDTLMIGGHGDPSSINLGKGSEESKDLDIGDEENLAGIKGYLIEKPTIILESCSTGETENAIGAVISRVLKARLFAPLIPGSLVDFEFDATGRIRDIEYTIPKNEFLNGLITARKDSLKNSQK